MTTTSSTSSTCTISVGVLSPHAIVMHGVAGLVAAYDRGISVHDLGGGLDGPLRWGDDVLLVDSELLAGGSAAARAAVAGDRPALVLVRPEHGAPRTPGRGRPSSTTVPALPMSVDGPTIVHRIRRASRLARPAAPEPLRADGPGRCAISLSVREVDVLRGVAAGRSNEEIAAALFVSINTVKTYIRTAYRKIGVGRRAEAVAWAMTHLSAPDAPGAWQVAGSARAPEAWAPWDSNPQPRD